MNLQHTASRTGRVHLIRPGSVRTLCGRLNRFTPTAKWPTWNVADASPDVRQRPTCDDCAGAARRLLFLKKKEK